VDLTDEDLPDDEVGFCDEDLLDDEWPGSGEEVLLEGGLPEEVDLLVPEEVGPEEDFPDDEGEGVILLEDDFDAEDVDFPDEDLPDVVDTVGFPCCDDDVELPLADVVALCFVEFDE
jgi:hypothetical protein